MLKIWIGQPNVLWLDEATNDVDIDTVTVLDSYLESFTGAVITVSHGRYILDEVATKLLIFEGHSGIESYYGSSNDYLANQSNKGAEKEALGSLQQQESVSVEEVPTQVPEQKKKLSYMEKKEWATIEDDIADLEAKEEALTEEMNHQGADFTKLQQLQQEIADVQAQLSEKMDRWEYLSEFV